MVAQPIIKLLAFDILLPVVIYSCLLLLPDFTAASWSEFSRRGSRRHTRHVSSR